MNVSECAHCGRPGPMHASLLRGGRTFPLCHPDDGLDCYRLVTVYSEPIGARKPGRELDGAPDPSRPSPNAGILMPTYVEHFGPYAVGGPLPPSATGRLGIIPSNGCCPIPPSVAGKLGHESDLLARLNAAGPRPSAADYEALADSYEAEPPRADEVVERQSPALVAIVQGAIFDELDRQWEAGEIDGAGYWNREEWGTLDGEPRWTKVAEAAVSAVMSHIRGTPDEIVARIVSQTIEGANRDGDR